MEWQEVLDLVTETKRLTGEPRKLAFIELTNREDVKESLLAQPNPRAKLEELKVFLPKKTVVTALAKAVSMFEAIEERALKGAMKPAKPEKASGSGTRAPSREDRLESASVAATGGIRTTGHCPPSMFPCTDLGNAERMVHLAKGNLHYVRAQKTWYLWNGKVWRKDDTGAVRTFGQQVVRSILAEANAADGDLRAALRTHSTKSESANALKHMLEQAESLPGVAITIDRFNRDPWLLNLKNGTLDLRTGNLRPHAREDFCSKLSPIKYDANAKCPTFDAFLESSLPDKGVRDFVLRACGYSMTGEQREHAFFIHLGAGRNGKGILENTMLDILGEYGTKVPVSLLMRKRNETHPTEKMTLLGARFAGASETSGGCEIDDAVVKSITGNEPITARYMNKDFVTFMPTHHAHLYTNHRPVIKDPTSGIWGRVHLIPWEVSFVGREDLSLGSKLKQELPGILNRLVAACREWDTLGLNPPDSVRASTSVYRDESDILGRFLSEMTVPGDKVGALSLYQGYQAWCKDHGETAWTGTAFGRSLGERGVKKTRTEKGVFYLGIRLVEVGGMHTQSESADDLVAKMLAEIEKSKPN